MRVKQTGAGFVSLVNVFSLHVAASGFKCPSAELPDMPEDGTHRAVVDRIVEEETAVMLLEGDDGYETQIEIPLEGLPRPAREQGAVLSLSFADGRLRDLSYRPAPDTE